MTVRATAETRLGRAVDSLVGAHPTESGIVLLADGRDSFAARALLAGAADRTLDIQYYIWVPERSYEVRLSPSRKLQWVERADSGEMVHDVEPGTTFWERAMVAVLSLLPIEWLL